MDRKSVAGLVALGLVLGGWSSAEAAFIPIQPYSYGGASISVYTGETPFNNIPIRSVVDGAYAVALLPYTSFDFEWINPKATSSVCTEYYGCEYGYELDSTKSYFVSVPNIKTVSGTVVTLTAGSDPFLFAGEVTAAPLPASLPMFGAALLGLGALAWRRRLKGAPEASPIAADR